MARSAEERKADLLKAVQERDGLVIATGAVADAADVSKPTARKYLEQLEEEGEVVEEELAGRMHVWYTPEVLEYGLGAFAGDDPPDPPDDAPARESDDDAELRAAGGPAVEQREPAEVMDTIEDLEDAVLELRKKVAALDDDDDDDDDGEEGPYAHVRSPARRWALRERDIMWNVMQLSAIPSTVVAAIFFAVVAFVPVAYTLPYVKTTAAAPPGFLLLVLLVVFTVATVTCTVLQVVLWAGIPEWADRVLPFRPDPAAATTGESE